MCVWCSIDSLWFALGVVGCRLMYLGFVIVCGLAEIEAQYVVTVEANKIDPSWGGGVEYQDIIKDLVLSFKRHTLSSTIVGGLFGQAPCLGGSDVYICHTYRMCILDAHIRYACPMCVSDVHVGYADRICLSDSISGAYAIYISEKRIR